MAEGDSAATVSRTDRARRLFARALTDPRAARIGRAAMEARRRVGRQPHTVVYHHTVADPHAHLAIQALPALMRTYDVAWEVVLVPGPDPDSVDRSALRDAWARVDAARVAPWWGYEFPESAAAPNAELIARANAILAHDLTPKRIAAIGGSVGSALWRGDGAALDELARRYASADPAATDKALAQGAKRLKRGGHFLPGTFYYGGAWYGGLDRIDHLERRLGDAKLIKRGGRPPALTRKTLTLTQRTEARPDLEMFLSVRSPYSAISIAPAREMARAMGVRLIARPVLPMVERGVKLGFAKSVYIVRDAAREAAKAGQPFGNIVDPLGAGVARTLAVWSHLDRADPERALDFLIAAMRGTWGAGLDLATDAGLAKVAKAAEVAADEVAAGLADPAWRGRVEAHSDRLADLGLWGVPTFKVGDFAVWGQDRLFLVEAELARYPAPAD